MKKIYLGLMVAAGLMCSSCNDYLEVDSPSSFDADYVFSNTSDAEKMLLGVYALFAQDPYTSRMSNVWMQNTDVEACSVSANPDGSRRDVWSLQGGLLESFGDIKKAWDNCLLAIDRANQCIEGIQASSIASNAEMQQMLGEAYCLRAYRYFMMCNFWGDVPYYREAAKVGGDLDKPKTDKNYIYTGMIQDLVNCEGNMQWSEQTTIERMNREFCLGLIAKLALFRAGYGMTADGAMKRADDYLDVASDENLAVTYTLNGTTKTARTGKEYCQLAADYCAYLNKLKGRDLNPDFQKIFDNESSLILTTNDEILYEVGFLAGSTGGGDVAWCIGVTVTGSSFGTTTIQQNFPISYYYSFDQKDLRRDVTISYVNYTADDFQTVSGINGQSCGKWSRLKMPTSMGSSSSKSTGINWPLMRWSDVLLMWAEAENEANNGPTATAKECLTKVRNRAFASENQSEKVTAYVSNLGSYEDFRNAIVDERAWEFGGECMRKFDLVRWNLYGKKIVETRTKLFEMGKAAFSDILESSLSINEDYKKYADKVYYQRTNGLITFANMHDRLTDAELTEIGETVSDDGKKDTEAGKYASVNWCKGLIKSTTTNVDTVDGVINQRVDYEPADFIVRSWRGYKSDTGEEAVPYLLVIGAETTATSDFLNNSGYGFITNSADIWTGPGIIYTEYKTKDL